MFFLIDKTPPTLEMIEDERRGLEQEIKRITGRDTIITFILILASSIATAVTVYWTTGQAAYAGIAASVFPILGAVLGLAGVIRTIGFRSSDTRLTDLRNALAALNPVSTEAGRDILSLSGRYPVVRSYQKQLESTGRVPVHGELAMYWEFDSSTQAKTARGREFLERARDAVAV